ncbi:MAG: o-succinylbenzoate synthase [Bacteroidia bacterium]
MYKARYKKHTLDFKRPSGTSRGVLTQKDTYYIIIEHGSVPEYGIGECSVLKGLSIDDKSNYEEVLKKVCKNINDYIFDTHKRLVEWPSICFGVETALKDLENGGKRDLFPSAFTEGKKGIYINGLIWMGSFDYMREQLDTKIKEGFKCIKIKIGGIEFEKELELLSRIRKHYSAKKIELRLDANGAFKNEEALDKLERLSKYSIHSIEQPIKQGSWKKMAELCKKSPIPIALDEELIGIHSINEKEKLVSAIKPQYLIFKPSLTGGFAATQEWIDIAEKHNVKWWITSALESNIGLNAIAQWTYTLKNKLPQGLGTGQLYTNNIQSPLVIEKSQLWYKNNKWNVSEIIK